MYKYDIRSVYTQSSKISGITYGSSIILSTKWVVNHINW